MKRKSLLAFLIVPVLSLVFWGCPQDKQSGDYQKTENGLEYKVYVSNDDAQKPKLGDFVTAVAVYRTDDTVFFDTRKQGVPYIFPIMEQTYKGDIFEGIQLMGIGDSVQFKLNADSLFLKTFRVEKLPPYINPGDNVYVDIKLLKVQSNEEFQAEQRQRFEQESQSSRNEEMEKDELNNYIQENSVTVQPAASGLYYIEVQKGTGAKAEAGKKVKVHYNGMLLDGKKFDSSYDRGQPFEFVLGQGQVIPGWEEGIAMMNVGGKATLIIPSYLAYGERGAGRSIPPYSTLIFEVELLGVE